jgi:hypothetical protein
LFSWASKFRLYNSWSIKSGGVDSPKFVLSYYQVASCSAESMAYAIRFVLFPELGMRKIPEIKDIIY